MTSNPPVRRHRAEVSGILAIGFVLLFLKIVVPAEGPLSRLEGALLTARFLFRGPEPPGQEIALVRIDDRTMRALGNWPLPHEVLAKTVDRLRDAGARVVALDLLLLNREKRNAAGPDPLAASLDRMPAALLPFAFLYGTPEPRHDEPQPTLRAAALPLVRYTAAGALLPEPTGVMVPPPELARAANLAHVNLFPEESGVIRHALAVLQYREVVFPSLPLDAARLFLDVPRDHLVAEMGSGIRIGDRFLPTDAAMRSVLGFYGPEGSFPSFSLIDLLEDRIAEERIRGRILLVGATASGLGDTFVTPFSDALPGVELLATEVANILHGDHLRNLPDLDLALLLLMLAVLLLSTRMERPVPLLLLLVLLLASHAVFTQAAFSMARIWLDASHPGIALIAGMLWLIALRLTSEHRRRRSAESASRTLARYVSPLTAFTSMRRHARPERQPLVPVAVMFVDLRNFTGLAEKLGPRETARLLSPFHALLERAIARHRGVIDKFTGDGAMALFGLETDVRTASADALAAATTITRELGEWADALRERNIEPPRIGIGIHAGPVVLGETGKRHVHVVVTGDTVNTASRLEGLARDLGATIVVSDLVFTAARSVGDAPWPKAFRRLPAQAIRGRGERVVVWIFDG